MNNRKSKIFCWILIIIVIFVSLSLLLKVNYFKEKNKQSIVYAIWEKANYEYVKLKSSDDIMVNLLFTYKNSQEEDNVNQRQLNYNGSIPKFGEVWVNNSGLIAFALYLDNKCYKKEFKDIKIKMSKNDNKCKINESIDKTLADNSIAINPNINTNMIPIKWDGSKWVKADKKNEEGPYSWYNYDNQKWANVALVSQGTRGKYITCKVGTPILENDIMAYLVWIPRFKYKLFNTNFIDMKEKMIDVIFESDDKDKIIGTINDTYLTHPAFIVNDKEISGFWIGKFETTGTPLKPSIKPNILALTNQNLSEQLETTKKFNNSDEYGISKIYYIHIINNIEWGAVAYLSQSKYGKYGNTLYNDDKGMEKEIYNNNININLEALLSSTITGCSSSYLNEKMIRSSKCPNSNQYFTKQGIKASTTGNIYGVYDMSGGSNEYVLGAQYDKKESKIKLSSSGLLDKNIKDIIIEKFLNKYNYGVNKSSYNRTILGDATGEVNGWNDDKADFIDNDNPWFIRGGSYLDSSKAGIFSFSNSNGESYINYSFRIGLVM